MKKFISVLISLCLLETAALGQGAGSAVSFAMTGGRQLSSAANPLLNHSNIASFNDAGSPFSVVIIQDLHCHPGVQKNISEILSRLHKDYNIKNIFVEGASGDFDTGWLSSMQDREFSLKAADALLAAGRLTGSEYFAYKNGRDDLLKGMENKREHLRNLERLVSIVGYGKDIQAVLSGMEKELASAQKENYGVFNKKLARLYKRYRAGKMDSARYYKNLMTYVRVSQKKKGIFNNIKIDAGDYPEISRYIKTNSEINGINFKAVSSQLSSVLRELKNKLAYSRYNRLAQRTDSFKNTAALFEELLAFDRENIIKLDKYGELYGFIKSSVASKDVNPAKMFEAERKLLKSLQLAGSLTEKEALIVVLSDLFDNYKDYYSARLTSDGYLYLKSFGVKKYESYFRDNISADSVDGLGEYYALFADYYESNINRDKIFAEIIGQKMPSRQGLSLQTGEKKGYRDILSGSGGISIAVCGGFHTQGLEKELKERKISYMVITPKIEGDYKTAAAIYEDMLMNNAEPSGHAIALQVLSQTGRNAQFKSIIESMLAQELNKNPDLNIPEYINEIAGKICAVDAEPLRGGGYGNYKKPKNEGVKRNKDGTFTLNISFEGDAGAREIIIREPFLFKGSIYGHRHAKLSPLWEWVYVLPFSSFIMASRAFKSFLHKTFLSGSTMKFVNSAMKYTDFVKAADALTSVLFIAGFFMNPYFFVFSAVLYSASRALIFAVSHINRFNVAGNSLQIKSNLIAAAAYLTPFLLSFFGVFGLAAGFFISIGLHMFYNSFISVLIAAFKNNNYVMTEKDLMIYFHRYEKRLQRREIKKSFTAFQKIKFQAMLALFESGSDKEAINETLPVLIRIAALLKDRKKAGGMVISINEAVSSKIAYANREVLKFIEQSDRNSLFMHILSYKNDRAVLEKIVADTELDIQFRLYAYALIRNRSGWDIGDFQKRQLLKEAKTLIRYFSWDKEMTYLVNWAKWAYNARLQSYITAVYMIMSLEHPEFMGHENPRIYEKIIGARFDGQYMNANSSLSFGADFFRKKDIQRVFPEIVAHELAHLSLDEIKFYTAEKFLAYVPFIPRKFKRNLQKTAVHELFADTCAYKLSMSSGRDPNWYMSVSLHKYEGKTFLSFSEPHLAARKQFGDFVNLLKSKGYLLEFQHFSDILKKEIVNNIDNKKISFEKFFFEVARKYLLQKNILAVDGQEDEGISLKELRSVCKALVFDISNSAFWEWVYMLPGVSYLTETGFFTNFISGFIMRGKHEELKKEKLGHLRSAKAVKLLDMAGSAVLIISLLTGTAAAAVFAYFLTRAVIFSYAHKDYSWEKNRSAKLRLAGMLLAFSFPAIIVLAFGGFGFSGIALSLAAGIPGNIFLHTLYNKYRTKIGILKNFPKADIVDDFKAGDPGCVYADSSAALIAERFVAKYGVFGKEHDERIAPADKRVTGFLKEKLGEKFNAAPGDIGFAVTAFSSERDILEDRDVPLYSFEEIGGKYLLRVDRYLFELFSKEELTAEKFVSLLDIAPVKSAETAQSALHKAMLFEVKGHLLKKRLRIPKLYEMKNMASEMTGSEYAFSEINHYLLSYLAGLKDSSVPEAHKQLIEFQLFEMLGYILQSQSWLSPALSNMQYGYLQKETMPSWRDSYERQLANTDRFERIFDKILARHYYSKIVKSKEAALFEYFRKKADPSASFIIPQTIADLYKNINIAGSKSRVYDFIGSAADLENMLKDAQKGKTGIYLIIDCFAAADGELEAIADIIDRYNLSAASRRRVKETVFYNAKPQDYYIAMKDRRFESVFIFDLSSFADSAQAGMLSKLFTSMPAVYAADYDFTADYGSRVDNFTLQYLHMLMFPESLKLFEKKKDSVKELRYNIKPSSGRISESILLYQDLAARLEEMDFFDGVREIAVNAALKDVKKCLRILKDKKSSARKLNAAVDEYRTLLNYLFYFRWSDMKDIGADVNESRSGGLASAYNSAMRKPVNSSGKEFSQETLLVTSGMSALAAIAAYLTFEEIQKIGLGRNIYYENFEMLKDISGIAHKEIFHEDEYTEVIRLSRSGTGAVFIDLVSNSVFAPDRGTNDIVASDIKRIVRELSKNKFKEPFYLCIDNSMYPSFRFADIFDGIDLPDNLNIIIYGSMQKMHQRGLEINTAGFLTLISNGFGHSRTMSKLKDAVSFTSSGLDAFRYISLKEFLQENSEFERRAAVLNENAGKLAKVLNEASMLLGGDFKIIHTSLYEGGQKEIWENNASAQIPFLFIRDVKSRFFMMDFISEMLLNLKEENFYDYVQRDSYGFDFLTDIAYSKDIIRLNIGDHSPQQLEKLTRALVRTFIRFAAVKLGRKQSVDKIYEMLKVYDINMPVNVNTALAAASFLSDEKTAGAANYSRLLKIFIIYGRLGMDAPENIVEGIKKIMLEPSGGLSGRERALLAEASVYFPDANMKNLLEKASASWISGKPLEEAAAALNLVEMLLPGKTSAPDFDGFIPERLNKKTVSGILKAA